MSGGAVFAAFLASAAASAATPPIVTFPGLQTSVRSPSSSARVFYQEMGADEGGQNLSLRVNSGRGRPIQIKRFDRSVDIGWSPSGQHFLVNDYIGSNLADCLIVRPGRQGVRGISLMRVIARSRGRPRETPDNSHYYVHCDGWASPTIIRGVVAGHTDEPYSGPLHPYAFEHAFSYDAVTGRINWHGDRIWGANAGNPH
jgi:hypothetical protein